jgi:hypothetical protein
MAEALSKMAGAGPEAPLFVTAYSPKGHWHEALLEKGEPAPAWFASPHHVRIQAPSGAWEDTRTEGLDPSEAYDTCLALLGARRAWAPLVVDEAAVPGLEVWTHEEVPVSVTPGAVLRVRRMSYGRMLGGAPVGVCYAAMRRKEGPAVWVRSTGWFYLDKLPIGNGVEVVPRGLLDLGLAGAFWGFTEHQNSTAARLAATRLLSLVCKDVARNWPSTWAAAAAHAVLTYRELLPNYGETVLALLDGKNAAGPDFLFLKALLGMARLSDHVGNKEAVKRDVRAAISALAHKRALYGETIRWLDAKFDVISHLALRDFHDGDIKKELAAISDWLRSSFAGGQAAVYLGDVPLDGEGWHDAFAEKKTPLK